jgi:hypothetical protein
VTLSFKVEPIRRNKGRNPVQLCCSPLHLHENLQHLQGEGNFICTRTVTTDILIKNIIQRMNQDNLD